MKLMMKTGFVMSVFVIVTDLVKIVAELYMMTIIITMNVTDMIIVRIVKEITNLLFIITTIMIAFVKDKYTEKPVQKNSLVLK